MAGDAATAAAAEAGVIVGQRGEGETSRTTGRQLDGVGVTTDQSQRSPTHALSARTF